MESMAASYDLVLVALSYVISVLGSFTALRLLRQEVRTHGREKWRCLFAGALAMGGGAIWSMHFIGMLAFDVGMPLRYDVPMTVGSLVVSIVVTGFGIYVVGEGPGNPWRLVGGGTAMGLGVAGMHYTGMAAMRMQATLSYDSTLVTVSVLIAVAASIAALWLVFHAVQLWQMWVSALVMGVAVCGMHYTGMRAAIMRHDLSLSGPSAPGFSAEILAYVIFMVTLVILSLAWLMAGGREVAKVQRVA